MEATIRAPTPQRHARRVIAHVWHRYHGTSPANESRLRRRLTGASALQHVATNFSRIILAFIKNADAPGGPAAFFNELSNFTQMFGSTLYVAQTLLGDAMVVSRDALAFLWHSPLCGVH